MHRTPAPAATRTLVAVAAVISACLALAGCSAAEGTGDRGYLEGSGQWREVPRAERGEPVELTGEDLEGRPLSLADLRGEPAVVVVWWSNCPPCRAEAPDVVSVANEVAGEASFVGLNIRDGGTAAPLTFERTFEVPYPSFFSPDGTALLAFEGTLTPMTIPAFVILDAEGRVASSIIGPLPSPGTLRTLVTDLVEEQTADG